MSPPITPPMVEPLEDDEWSGEAGEAVEAVEFVEEPAPTSPAGDAAGAVTLVNWSVVVHALLAGDWGSGVIAGCV